MSGKKQGEKRPGETRNHGGSIKTINGILYARIQYVDETTGKRKEKLRRAENRTNARQLIKQMRDEYEARGADAFNSDKLTFEQLADKYEKTKLVDAVFVDGRKVSGLKSARQSKVHLAPLRLYFGRKHIKKIKPNDLETYKHNRLSTKTRNDTQRKIASVNRELALLRAMLNFAAREGWIVQNPFQRASGIISNASEVERDRVLSFDEEQRLLDACGERTKEYKRKRKDGGVDHITAIDKGGSRRHLRPIIVTAIDTAMRRGELFKLQWKDVDLNAGTIIIQAANSKTEKTRIVGLTKRANAELETLWNKSPKDSEQLVFGITDTIKNAWASLCKTAAITDFRFHDLRHTATTRMVRAGLPHTEVMKITGHTQIKTFLRYLSLTPATATSGASLLSAYLNEQHLQNTNAQSNGDLVN